MPLFNLPHLDQHIEQNGGIELTVSGAVGLVLSSIILISPAATGPLCRGFCFTSVNPYSTEFSDRLVADDTHPVRIGA